MIRLILSLSLLVLFYTNSIAQLRKKQVKKEKKSLIIPSKSILLRWNVVGLLDPIETNFSVGAEYLMSQKKSVALDIGTLTFSRFFEGIEKSSGLIIRPSFRNYFGKENRWYADIEMHFKFASLKMYDWLGKNCVNNVPAYEELQNFTLRKNSKGLHAKIGTVIRLDKAEKLFMDWYVGAGVRSTKFSIKDEPRACYDNASIVNLRTTTGTEFFPVVQFGFRLAYKIK